MLKVESLSKSFGSYKALDNMNFTIEDGKILGLIGQNGAGKTTTFRLILDFLSKDSGVFCGMDMNYLVTTITSLVICQKNVGFIPRLQLKISCFSLPH